MTRRLLGATVATFTCLGVLGLGFASAGTNEADPPTIKEVMKKLNAGPKSESGKLKKALGTTKPDWTAIQASAKEFGELGPALAENDPPKGDKEHWKTVAEAYGTESKALSAAAESKDLPATKKAFANLNKSCKACHDQHKGK